MPEKSSNAPELRPGDVVNNRYIIQRELGSGNFSNVYACLDNTRPENERAAHPLALKILKREYKSDAYFEKRMLQLLDDKDVNHTARVCKMFDFFEWKELPIFIMPVHGPPLRSRKLGVGRGVVTRSNVVQFAYELLDTLRFIHFTCRMVHTDLKPENILIADRDTPANSLGHHWVVCDFGSASQWDMEKLDSDLISTRPYRAPEVVLGRPWFYAADIWSAGCIIFEVAVGNRLFEVRDDNTHLQLMAKRLGPLPELLTVKSRYSPKFFNRRGEVLSPSDAIRNGKVRSTSIKEVFSEDPKMLELLTALLSYDPKSRITADKALMLPIFDSTRERRHSEAQAAAAAAAGVSTKVPTAAATTTTTTTTKTTTATSGPVKTLQSPLSPPRPPVTVSGSSGNTLVPAAATATASPLTGAAYTKTPSSYIASPIENPNTRPSFIVASETEEEQDEDSADSNTHRPSRSQATRVDSGKRNGQHSESQSRKESETELVGAQDAPTTTPFTSSTATAPSAKGTGFSYAEAFQSAGLRPSATAAAAPSSPLGKNSAASPTQTHPSAFATAGAASPLGPPVTTTTTTTSSAVSSGRSKDKDKEKEKEKDKDKDREKDKRRKTESKTTSASAKGLLNIDDLSTLVLSDAALEEAVQTAEEKRKPSSKHARKSASGYMVASSSGSVVGEEPPVPSPNSIAKDRSSTSFVPMCFVEGPTTSHTAAAARSTVDAPTTTAKATSNPTASAPTTTTAASARTAIATGAKTVSPAPLLTSSERGGVASVRPISAVAVGGSLAHGKTSAGASSTAGLTATDVAPLTVLSEVGMVDKDAPLMTSFETTTPHGAGTQRRMLGAAEGSLPRLQRSVSRDRAGGGVSGSCSVSPRPSASRDRSSEGPAPTDAANAVPSPSHSGHEKKKKVRRASMTGSAAARTPRGGSGGGGQSQGQTAPRSPRVASGRGNSKPTTPRSRTSQTRSDRTAPTTRAPGTPSSTTTHTPAGVAGASQHPRTSSGTHNASGYSQQSSSTMEPHSPLSPRRDKDGGAASASAGGDGAGPSYRMHRMPAALAAKSQRATNHRRNLEAGPANITAAGSSASRPQNTSSTVIMSRPAPSASLAASASSKGTSIGNSHSTRVALHDEESEVEMLSCSTTQASSEASARVGGPADVCLTAVAQDNRQRPRAATAATRAPTTTTTTATNTTTNTTTTGPTKTVVEDVSVATITSPYRISDGRMTVPPANPTTAPQSVAPNVVMASPKPAARRVVPSSAAAAAMRPTQSNPQPPPGSFISAPGSVLREDTFFLDTPNESDMFITHSSQYEPRGHAGLRAGESPSPGLEPAPGLRAMARSPQSMQGRARADTANALAASADDASAMHFPRFPYKEDGTRTGTMPMVSLAGASADPFMRSNTSNTGVPGYSPATSTTSIGTAERQMRTMIAKPRGIALSSDDEDDDGGNNNNTNANAAVYRGRVPISFGAAGVSPRGSAHVPLVVGRQDSDLYNHSQGSVDRLVAALYGGKNLDGAVAASAGVSGAAFSLNNSNQPGAGGTAHASSSPSTSATTVHATLSPNLGTYAGVTMKPLNLANTSSGVTGSAGASTSGGAGASATTRSPRSGRKGERSRRTPSAGTASAPPSSGAAKGTAGSRGRRSSKDITDPLLLDEYALETAPPYVAPHANAAVHLPYSTSPSALSSSSPSAVPHAPLAVSHYGATTPQPPQQTRSQFTGLLPLTPGSYAGNGARRAMADVNPSAMPNRVIPGTAGSPNNNNSGNSASPTAPGRNITSTSGAGYTG